MLCYRGWFSVWNHWNAPLEIQRHLAEMRIKVYLSPPSCIYAYALTPLNQNETYSGIFCVYEFGVWDFLGFKNKYSGNIEWAWHQDWGRNESSKSLVLYDFCCDEQLWSIITA